eukprot:3249483-Rhodomonas_salina.1
MEVAGCGGPGGNSHSPLQETARLKYKGKWRRRLGGAGRGAKGRNWNQNMSNGLKLPVLAQHFGSFAEPEREASL